VAGEPEANSSDYGGFDDRGPVYRTWHRLQSTDKVARIKVARIDVAVDQRGRR
jgi:hypothetical protein